MGTNALSGSGQFFVVSHKLFLPCKEDKITKLPERFFFKELDPDKIFRKIFGEIHVQSLQHSLPWWRLNNKVRRQSSQDLKRQIQTLCNAFRGYPPYNVEKRLVNFLEVFGKMLKVNRTMKKTVEKHSFYNIYISCCQDQISVWNRPFSGKEDHIFSLKVC